MPNQETFYEKISGQHLQHEEWWFLRSANDGHRYVTVEQFSIGADGKFDAIPTIQTFSVEEILSQNNEVAEALRGIVPAIYAHRTG